MDPATVNAVESDAAAGIRIACRRGAVTTRTACVRITTTLTLSRKRRGKRRLKTSPSVANKGPMGTHKRFKAAVIGGSGYGGAELIRRLLLHPHVELVRVASVDYVGEPLSAAHPNLEGLTDLKFEGIAPEEA